MNSLVNLVGSIFPDSKLLLLYYSGSKGYGFDDENSDVDVTAVLENFQGSLHLQLGTIDIFAFSKEEYIKRQNFDDSVIDYYKSAADDAFVLEDKVIRLDSTFEETYESLKTINVKQFMVNQLTALLNYTKMRFEMDTTFKSHYHVFRYRGIIEHFDKNGVFGLTIDEPWFSEMLRYKRNWNNDIGKSYVVKIKEQIEYLEQYRDRMIQDGLGEYN